MVYIRVCMADVWMVHHFKRHIDGIIVDDGSRECFFCSHSILAWQLRHRTSSVHILSPHDTLDLKSLIC